MTDTLFQQPVPVAEGPNPLGGKALRAMLRHSLRHG